MSTRGAVGVKTKRGYEAIYNHWDSYPSGLGFESYEYVVENYIKKGKSFNDFKSDLLRYTEWREFLHKGVCPYCGKHGVGQPVNISGIIFGLNKDSVPKLRERALYALEGNLKETEDRDLQYIWDSINNTGYPDPEARYHKHTLDDVKSVKETHITPDNSDPLFIEWMYIFYEKDGKWMMDIYANKGYSKSDGNKEKIYDTPQVLPNGKVDYGHCVYWHEKVATLEVDPHVDIHVLQEKMERIETTGEDE